MKFQICYCRSEGVGEARRWRRSRRRSAIMRTQRRMGKWIRVPAAMVPRKSALDKEVAAWRVLTIKRVLDNDGYDSLKDTIRRRSVVMGLTSTNRRKPETNHAYAN